MGRLPLSVARRRMHCERSWRAAPSSSRACRGCRQCSFTHSLYLSNTCCQAIVKGRAARKKRKLLQKRSYIVREIVESEKTYVKNLGLCVTHFYAPMKELPYINDLTLRQMFSEITVIQGFNTHLCMQLEQRLKVTPPVPLLCLGLTRATPRCGRRGSSAGSVWATSSWALWPTSAATPAM